MAVEIKVLSTTAMKTTLDELIPQFERATGHRVAPDYAPSARIAKRIADGEENDVAIVTAQGADALIKNGKIVARSRADIAQSTLGLAVQKGARKPDISSADKFKQALLAAKSIAMSNPVGGGQSGAHLAKLFDRMGIADALKSKVSYGPGGPAGLIGFFLVRGEAEIGIQQMPELMAVPGIDIVGPLPAEIQAVTVFSAGVSTTAKDPDAAQALTRFLASADAKAVMRAKGMETP